MGDPSSLRLVPAESASIPINWSRVPEAVKKFLLGQYGYDWNNETDRPLPETIGDLAKMLDESKFFGYMGPELCTLLMDISEFGLAAQAPEAIPPRFYMSYLQQVWFILFLPGRRDGITGYSHYIVRDKDGASDYKKEEERLIAKELKLAQEFDAQLAQQFPRGAANFVNVTHTLCGWQASTLRTNLENAQFMTAVQTLPTSHPVHRDVFHDMFSRSRAGGSGFA